MKEIIKDLLCRSGLIAAWNRWAGGNSRQVRGQANRVQIGHSVLTCTTIRITGQRNSLIIGDRCRLHDLKILLAGNDLRVEISNDCLLRGKIKLEDTGSQVIIGAGTTMENAYLGAYEGAGVLIGKDCMLSDQVGIRTGDMHSIVDAATGVRLNPSQSVTIEPHVWLCRGTTVLKGCTIGANTVVGGFSIVTRSLPAGVLAAGSPAQAIRHGIQWQRERFRSAAPGAGQLQPQAFT